MNTDPYARYNSPTRLSGRHAISLLSFPSIVLTTYLWPTPTTFARHKNHATRGSLVALLVFLTLITGIGAYLWGRLPSLSYGLQTLSLNHLTLHPLSPTFVILLALAAPLLILAFAGALHFLAHTQQGQGSYHVQLYSLLVIETLPIFMLVAFALLLLVAPTMGAVVRIPFAAAAIVLLLYSLLLLVLSLMGVQQLSPWQAVLCLVTILTVVLLLVVCSDLFSSDHTSHGSSDGKFKKPRKRPERLCPHCGFSLEVYDQLHKNALTQSCPKCGKPLF